MLLTEYNEARQMELFREDGRAEGRAEGAFDTLSSLVRDDLLPLPEAAARFGIPEEEFRRRMSAG